MASRHNRIGVIEELYPFHINAVASTRTQLPTTPGTGGPALDLGHGVTLARVIVGNPGSAMALTIYNGNVAANVVSVINPTAAGSIECGYVLEQGLWFTYQGTTAGDICLVVWPMSV